MPALLPATLPAAVRQLHRWLSILFTLAVIANFATIAFVTPLAWVVYAPLPPLFAMLATGLHLFALPYARRWRTGT